MIVSFAKDKNEQNVRTEYDIDNFHYFSIQEIKLYCKEQQVGRFEFLYFDDGFIEIYENKVETRKIWHGKILIEAFINIIPKINIELHSTDKKQIEFIKGKIDPDNTTSYEELELFYRKSGFEIMDNREIYKKV